MKRLAMLPLVGLLTAAACTLDNPTAPIAEDALSGIGISASVSASASQPLNFDADLDIITSRLLPGFANGDAAENLSVHVAGIKTELAANNRAGAAQLVGLARAELISGASSIADLGYISLVLDNIDRAIVQ